MTITLSGLVLLGIVFMPQLLFVLAPGFVGEALRFPLAVELTRITFPYLLFICLAALVSGVLNGMDRFGARRRRRCCSTWSPWRRCSASRPMSRRRACAGLGRRRLRACCSC
jgi:hypothetical protein